MVAVNIEHIDRAQACLQRARASHAFMKMTASGR
jgi:hypothetical protein